MAPLGCPGWVDPDFITILANFLRFWGDRDF
jgi:hypothetical protein